MILRSPSVPYLIAFVVCVGVILGVAAGTATTSTPDEVAGTVSSAD